MAARIENRAALDEFVGALTRAHNAHELTVQLQAAGVAAYPVQNCVDIHQDDNLEAFGFWHWLDHKEMGPSPYEGLEHRMSRTPGDAAQRRRRCSASITTKCSARCWGSTRTRSSS